jgi:hypothetical protein
MTTLDETSVASLRFPRRCFGNPGRYPGLICRAPLGRNADCRTSNLARWVGLLAGALSRNALWLFDHGLNSPRAESSWLFTVAPLGRKERAGTGLTNTRGERWAFFEFSAMECQLVP